MGRAEYFSENYFPTWEIELPNGIARIEGWKSESVASIFLHSIISGRCMKKNERKRSILMIPPWTDFVQPFPQPCMLYHYPFLPHEWLYSSGKAGITKYLDWLTYMGEKLSHSSGKSSAHVTELLVRALLWFAHNSFSVPDTASFLAHIERALCTLISTPCLMRALSMLDQVLTLN